MDPLKVYGLLRNGFYRAVHGAEADTTPFHKYKKIKGLLKIRFFEACDRDKSGVYYLEFWISDYFIFVCKQIYHIVSNHKAVICLKLSKDVLCLKSDKNGILSVLIFYIETDEWLFVKKNARSLNGRYVSKKMALSNTIALSQQVKDTLFDINGKAALSQMVNGSSAQINMSRLLAGNYILRLVENGMAIVKVKISKGITNRLKHQFSQD